ncbi:hypothetical protein VaNZ11_002940 [Volvox africanus]|uniref:Uncharacterized protein n=1 Tax=Volvox africanus TaxID=51714 RepID=A0ABQ5RUF4_9CHLO|nr:hypothetical protein VaNZ11_002940 [Volvox africanus]
MLRKRQEQAGPKKAPSALDSWVSSDSHFVPAQQNPSDVNAPPRPPVAKTTVTSFLGTSRPASVAGDASYKAGSCGGSVASSAAPSPAARSCSNIQLGDGNCDGGIIFDDRTDAKSHHRAAAYSKFSPSHGNHSGGQDFWMRRLGGASYKRSLSAAAAAMAIDKSSIGGTSPATASGLPETPCLRSPEWSPRRTSRSSGSAPSPLPLTDTMAMAPTVMAPVPASILNQTCDQPCRAGGVQVRFSSDAGVEAAAAAPPSDEHFWRPETDQAGIGCNSKVLCDSHGQRIPLEGRYPMAASVLSPASGGAPAPLGGDPQDLSLLLSMVAAVRSTVGAARDLVSVRVDNRQSGAVGSGHGRGLSSHHGVTGEDSAGSSGVTFQGSAGLQDGKTVTSSQATSGAHQVSTADVTTTVIDGYGADIACAVVAAPTSVLAFVLAVRLIRAALRWPVVASFCAAFIAWLGALLALSTALFAAGRITHRMVQVAWAIVASVLGCRALIATQTRRPPYVPQ